MSSGHSQVVFHIEVDIPWKMFFVQDQEGLQLMEEKIMELAYETLSPTDKSMVLSKHIESRIITQQSKHPLKTLIFKEGSRRYVLLLCTLLGYENDN